MIDLYEKGVSKTIYVNGIAVGEYVTTGDPQRDIEAAHEIIKSKGLHKETTEVDAMHSQANSFANTAKELYERDLRTVPIKNSMSMVPFVVNAAFSIEIYLKTVHAISGSKVRGHSLVKLYEGLGEDIKTIILSAANDLRQYYDIEGGADFADCIETLDKAFEQWRYAYEYEKLSYVGFQATRFVYHVLHESCCRARPNE